MTGLQKFFSLYKQQTEIWQQIDDVNSQLLSYFDSSKDSSLEEEEKGLKDLEQYLQQKQEFLENLSNLQPELEKQRKFVEEQFNQRALPEYPNAIENLNQAKQLEEKIRRQEVKLKQKFQENASYIREQIKKFRNKKLMNDSYSPVPILEESALLDEKQ